MAGTKEISAEVINGGAMLARLNELIRKAADDVIAREGVAKARSIGIKITITPNIVDLGGGRTANFPKIEWTPTLTIPLSGGMSSSASVERRAGKMAVCVDASGEAGAEDDMFAGVDADSPAPGRVVSATGG